MCQHFYISQMKTNYSLTLYLYSTLSSESVTTKCYMSGNCQAQPQIQFKLSVKAELALISVNLTIQQPPSTHNLIFGQNGRRPQFHGKWKTASLVRKMEDDLNCFLKERRPQFFVKWKTTSICWQMEVDPDFRWRTTSVSY